MKLIGKINPDIEAVSIEVYRERIYQIYLSFKDDSIQRCVIDLNASLNYSGVNFNESCSRLNGGKYVLDVEYKNNLSLTEIEILSRMYRLAPHKKQLC